MTAGLAESKRIPFDLPESESELVAGYFTEYSGPKHLLFMMSDFVDVVLVAALVTTLFFGGWQVPYLARRVPLPVGHRRRAAVARGRAPPGDLVRAEARLLHVAPDRHPLDAAALPLRPAHAARLAGLLPLRSRTSSSTGLVIVLATRPAA
jgi:hypothetical protein